MDGQKNDASLPLSRSPSLSPSLPSLHLHLHLHPLSALITTTIPLCLSPMASHSLCLGFVGDQATQRYATYLTQRCVASPPRTPDAKTP